MTKEALKGLLGNPEVVIVDARIDRDWDASEFKIKGAVRGNPLGFLHWVSRYPKDTMLVLYCA